VKRFLFLSLAAFTALAEAQTAQQRAALARITAEGLRGHVSFLASDLLEGRGTPSRGLDIAAEYIAAQFRRAGLDAAGPGGYFQLAAVKLPQGQEATGKNVAAVLRGSSPELRDTYVVVSAHYDHLGMLPAGEGDRIFNGANDDASGVAAVLEMAEAMRPMSPPPRRSILFLLFFGEESGFVGSRYYLEHPLVPLEKTVADLNLEQLGRTDENGRELRRVIRLTGAHFSNVESLVAQAAQWTGVRLEIPKENSFYFRFSDNFPFAQKGIPAHTLAVAFTYPDYHAVTDHWEKLDYENMAIVTRTAALAAMLLADHTEVPKWNRKNPELEKALTSIPGR